MDKYLTLQEAVALRKALRKQGKTMVLTNGCFDLLHGGHIHLFKQAKKLGDVLIVAVNDDASIQRLKGPNRPIFPLEERVEVLEAVAYIDYLLSFSQDTPKELITALLPDILVKGGDWAHDEVVGRVEVKGAGGKVVVIPYLPGYSSTEIIKKIRALK
ncbi:MAG: D-glycero-beta-D-manno-heptose 1-phosphate adenylyltransferase [Candidatus Aminicenantes bacterium]|nr:D-glycero-beta-D-manno-heptose 1-phosphate adenylyltransferase [Candidatus Aminicenantes bacterium]